MDFRIYLVCFHRVIARQCMETVDIMNYHIEEGTIVHANVWELHNDTSVWGTDPSTFDPERYLLYHYAGI